MAFDMGFDFRNTAGYVTDPAYGVPVLQEAYPHTYTNSNGNSINGGWDANIQGSQDVAAGNDPRIAGDQFRNNTGTPATFTIDLSSGSAPGAGTYTLDVAMGDPSTNRLIDFQVKDNSTVLIDGTNGGAGFDTGSAGHFIDATLANIAATVAWTGTTVSKTFATTTAKVVIGIDNIGGFTLINHFRLTLAAVVGFTQIPLLARYP